MKKKGFTLMEMLAVVMIIGILSAIAIPQYQKVMEKGNFTKAQVMAKAMHDSCERLVAEYGVDNYSSLPAAVKTLGRLDIGEPRLLPAGFSCTASNGLCTGSVITGLGFRYTLAGNCAVVIEKNAGNYRATVAYTGEDFICVSETDAGACEVYGLDSPGS